MTLFQSIVTTGKPAYYRVLPGIGVELDRFDLYTEEDAVVDIYINEFLWRSTTLTAGDFQELLSGIKMTLGTTEVVRIDTSGTSTNSLRVRVGGK